jgi:phage tail sheath protein FI
MGQMKTPGVYIVEKNAFPNSVVEVATAVPAFIGYTQIADNQGKSLLNKPWRITSLAEFHQYFGFGPTPQFEIKDQASPATEPTAFKLGSKEYLLSQPAGKEGGRFLLYYGMRQFFQNGGGPCYVVSVGDYGVDAVDAAKLAEGIGLLIKEQEPTMVVIPDCMLLKQPDCISVQQAALAHCGTMKSRVAVLDIWEGYKPPIECIGPFRNDLGINYLDYAAAYYPWLNTTVVQDNELSYANVKNLDALQALLKTELALPDALPDNAAPKLAAQWQAVQDVTKTEADWIAADTKSADIDKPHNARMQVALLNKSLAALSPTFNTMMGELKNKLNLLPPSPAMAGIYTMVDNSRGVWKAPANVSLSGVISPAVSLSAEDQEDLNVTTQGKSVNAIRSFIGEGVLVWGARTLDGNSLDWRYISVRRTMIMLEESCRLAAKAMVFEPNVANTWVTIKSMIQNFLTGIWKRGGLAGAVPDDAFSVHVGLGETMTPEDVLEGILRVTVLVAISRPAEFIEITFQQQMQKS